ncbi:Chromosome transmission fidelity protein 18 [Batrachochytrium dendrobatidis]|nr:Chromosome transmission fidelity protein 18 [Batrachochytrium dendrobatidis]
MEASDDSTISRNIDAWEAMYAEENEALQLGDTSDCLGALEFTDPFISTQHSGINELFQSNPHRGSGVTGLFFDCDDDGLDVSSDHTGDPSQRVANIQTKTHDRHRVEHRSHHTFYSSPPAFTSPSFCTDQPMPVPSNLDIVRTKKPKLGDLFHNSIEDDVQFTFGTASALDSSQAVETRLKLDDIMDLPSQSSITSPFDRDHTSIATQEAKLSLMFSDTDDNNEDTENDLLLQHAQQHSKIHQEMNQEPSTRVDSILNRIFVSDESIPHSPSNEPEIHQIAGLKRSRTGLLFDSGDEDGINEYDSFGQSLSSPQRTRQLEYNYSVFSHTNATAESFNSTASSLELKKGAEQPTLSAPQNHHNALSMFRTSDILNVTADSSTPVNMAAIRMDPVFAMMQNSKTASAITPTKNNTPASSSKHIPPQDRRDKATQLDESLRSAAQSVMAQIAAKTLSSSITDATEKNTPSNRDSLLYKHAPTDRSFVTAVTSSGTRFYFPKQLKNGHSSKRSITADLANNPSTSSTKLNTNLREEVIHKEYLSTPIHRLMEQVQGIRTQLQMDKMLADEHASRNMAFNQSSTLIKLEKKGTAEALWVDKYRPKMYVDMVGDEQLNRQVLTWVKQWDYCVFGKPVKRTLATMNQSQFRKKSLFDQHKPVDKLQRPDRRILFLCGPPGLGKTTLAHVVAHHAGYNVVEINASDDRTTAVLKDKIISAVESQAVMGNKKPNLVIIDEIDGVNAGGGDQAFIKMLIKLTETKDSAEDSDFKSSKKVTKLKKKVQRQLRRPIICICNDQYAQVLRPLRQVAQVFTFRPPPFQALAKRLYEICRWEGLHADLRTMMALCEMTQGDMRSAIHTLQFLSSKADHLTKEMLLGIDIGHKDFSRGLFKVWQMLFSMPSVKEAKRVGYMTRDEIDANRAPKQVQTDVYIDRIVSTLQHAGEYDKIMQGCFEFYPQTSRFETMRSTSQKQLHSDDISDTTNIFDQLESRITRNQQFELMPYQPYMLVNFYRLFANAQGRHMKMEFPRADYAAFVAKRETEGIMQTFITAAKCGEWRQISTVRLELVPFLVAILSPELRPANIQSLSPTEQATLDRLVSIMSTFGIRMIPKVRPTGHTLLEFDPPIHDMLILDQTRQPINEPSQTIKQLISHEIERNIVRKKDLAMQNEMAKRNATTSSRVLNPEDKSTVLAETLKKAIVSRQVMVPIEEQPVRDFFGRLVDTKVPTVLAMSDKENKAPESLVRLAYKYNEGFSNAVRTTVYVKDFF